jgi:hypothetical protein
MLALITTNDTEHEVKVNADEYFNDSKTEATDTQQPRPVETAVSPEDSRISKQKFAKLDEEIKNLEVSCNIGDVEIFTQNSSLDEIERRYKEELDTAKRQINELHRQEIEKEQQWSTIKTKIDQKYEIEREMQEQNLRITIEENTELTNKIQQMQKRKEKLKQIEKRVRTVAYTNIQIELMRDFIMPKFKLLIDYVEQNVKNTLSPGNLGGLKLDDDDIQYIDEHFAGRVPKFPFFEENGTYTINVTGFPDHHTTFKASLKRLINLSNSYNSGKEFYQRYLNRIIRSINKKLMQVEAKTHCWRQYIKILIELLEEKNIEYLNRFNDSIREKAKSLIEQSIRGILNPPWVELREYTDDFLERNSFENEIEALKHRALDEFIKQNISFQRLKIDRIPTEQSINTIKYFIEQIKITLMTNPSYQGHEVQHFSLIPILLQQIMIYYSCFTVQLPLFESSRDLLNKIEIHTVTTITTSTGSGKNKLHQNVRNILKLINVVFISR